MGWKTLVLDNSCAVIERGDAVENGSAAPWAVVIDESVQRLSGARIAGMPAGVRVVAWSGSMADELFGEDPRTWGPAGWAALDAACERAAPVLAERGATMALRTHARHVLSDVPSCERFVRERRGRHGEVFRVLLDPVSMLAPSMLAMAEDHLRRMVGAIGTMAPGLAGIVIGPGAGGALEREAMVLAGLLEAGGCGGMCR